MAVKERLLSLFPKSDRPLPLRLKLGLLLPLRELLSWEWLLAVVRDRLLSDFCSNERPLPLFVREGRPMVQWPFPEEDRRWLYDVSQR